MTTVQKTGVDRLQPIAKLATATIIADQVRELISDGTFPPGSQVTELALANALGVSRGPVREALQRLVQEGLLTSERNKGLFVTTLTADDIDDIYRTRAAIELCAMQVIMDSVPERFVNSASALLDRLEEAIRDGDYGLVSELDLEFHISLVEESGSKRLARAYSTLISETRMCLRALEFNYASEEYLGRIHRGMVDAIRNRDYEAARTAIEDHNATVLRIMDPSAQDSV